MPELVRSRCQGGSAERGEEGKDSEPGSTWNFFFFFWLYWVELLVCKPELEQRLV